MTLPDERTRAVMMTEKFLIDLTNASKVPNVPKHVREHARMLLRHYPMASDLATVNTAWNEPIAKFVMQECPFEHPNNVRLPIKLKE